MKKKYIIEFAMGIYSTQQEVIAESEDEAFKKAWQKMNDEDIKGGDIQFEEDDVTIAELNDVVEFDGLSMTVDFDEVLKEE